MKFNKQLNRHDPDNGVWGDCFRTAIACFFDLEPQDVPHFLDGGVSADQFRENYRAWLSERGFMTFQMAFIAELKEVLTTMKMTNPGVYYLISGCSPRGTTHVCVGLDDEIVHDPAIDGGGLVGPCTEDGYYWIEVLIPRDIHLAKAA